VTRTALIAGAGIGGLSAAIAPRRAGWNVRVFERAASPRELGFGVALAPNAIAALGQLGVADQIVARGFAMGGALGELRRMDGTVLKRAQVPSPEVLGGTMVIALRPALHGALLDAVGKDAIAVGHEVTGFSDKNERIVLHFANGQSADGDLLVGADGVRSVIRRALHPAEPPPRFSGIVSVRGAVEGAQEHLGPLAAVYYLGPGVESMFVRASDTGIYWFLALAQALLPARMTDPVKVVAHMTPHFDATFRAITSVTRDVRFDALVDRDPIPSWGRGGVTLLGDAAHPLLPHTGQGAAQAIVDGVTLGASLSGDGPVGPALQTYERDRRENTAALLAQGRRTARVMRMTNPIACYLREMAIRIVPVKSMVTFYARINRRARTDVRRR
jgi:2-polyprenyl-6-methoxyphenol hydroxylase-like FAD-dependent oxidoreductase